LFGVPRSLTGTTVDVIVEVEDPLTGVGLGVDRWRQNTFAVHHDVATGWLERIRVLTQPGGEVFATIGTGEIRFQGVQEGGPDCGLGDRGVFGEGVEDAPQRWTPDDGVDGW